MKLCKRCKKNEPDLGYRGKNSKWCVECLAAAKRYKVSLKRDRQRKFVVRFNRSVFL